FQAEDGIRDRNVTGVQTCALPILGRLIAVATWLRAQAIRTHSLTLSNQQRLDKAGRLYSFMTSDRVADRWDRMTQTVARMKDAQIGRASCRESVEGWGCVMGFVYK